jgi:hypothetical protein
VPDPFAAAEDSLPALELVLEHARRYLAELDGVVRAPGADEAARSFAGPLPRRVPALSPRFGSCSSAVRKRTSARGGRGSSTG